MDDRGTFVETWSDAWLDALPPATHFHRDGQASNPERGTLRGLHAQRGLGKLVRVASGSVYDVAVDVRPGSPTRGHHAGVVLSAAGGEALWVPPGFAHGYVTLTDHAVVGYRFTGQHVPGDEIGVRWDDPDLAIAWPVRPVRMSERDRGLPRLRELG